MYLLLVDIYYDRITISFYIFLVSCLLFNVVFVRKLSEIPEKASGSFLSEAPLPKLFGPKVFDFNVFQKFFLSHFDSCLECKVFLVPW